MRIYISIIALLTLAHGYSQTPMKSWRLSHGITINQINPSVYIHESMLVYKGDSVSCNGLVYAPNDIGILIDTPNDSASTDLLISFFEDSLNIRILQVLVTHFHTDALGGLGACHARGIHTQGYWTTARLAKKNGHTPPKSRVKSSQTMLNDHGQCAIFFYPGQGHTKDNSVVYLPKESVLFGGCLVKSLGADVGNLDDANIKKWPTTINVLINKFPDAEIVIPGHGEIGNQELLKYTAELFSNYKKN